MTGSPFIATGIPSSSGEGVEMLALLVHMKEHQAKKEDLLSLRAVNQKTQMDIQFNFCAEEKISFKIGSVVNLSRQLLAGDCLE